MHWTDRRKKNDWRSCLTAEEEAKLEWLDQQIEALLAKRSNLTRARQLIQNRATTRFRQRNQNDKNRA